MRRLLKKSWAQLKFHARKTLATAYRGEELKDSYRINGRAILRFVTADGNLDHELPIDVTVDDFPF